MERVWVGTSGWSYDHWRSVFYPEELPTSERLRFYCQRFNTVEVNSSFYHLPLETTFRRWGEATPDDFIFSVKGSRYVTHIKKMVDPKEAVDRLLGRAALLGSKLGPILWQVPPQLKRDDARLEGILRCLPSDLANVFEFRHKSWFCSDVHRLLERYDASFCCVSSPDLVTDLVTTGKAGYMRMHGEGGWYSSNYTQEQLELWAARISEGFSDCERSFVYFNNDANAYAVANAVQMRKLLEKL